MSYQKNTWIDHIVDPSTGDVVQQGTKFTATRANHMESGIERAHQLIEDLAQTAVGSAVVSGLIFSNSGLTASWTSGIAYVNGVRFDVAAGSIALSDTQGQYIYLDSDGIIKKTTSRDAASAQCLLWYFATDASSVITSTDQRTITTTIKTPTAASVTIEDANNRFAGGNVEEALAELSAKDSTIAADAKAYTDQQVALVTASGIPKLVSYSYVLTATTSGQTDFDIPLATFVAETDTVMVVQNRTTLNKNDYSIVNVSGANKVRLAEGVSSGTEIALLILKNVPQGAEGSISASVLADGTISAAKLDTALQQKVAQLEKYKKNRSGKDANGVFTVLEYRRVSDNTLYMKSTLSNPDSKGSYQTDTRVYYKTDGTTVDQTVTVNRTYDADGDWISEVPSA